MNTNQSYLYHTEALNHLVERVVRGLPEEGHAASRRLQAEVRRLRNGVEAMGKLHVMKNPLDSAPMHEKKVSSAARRLATEVSAAHERLHTIVREGLIDISARIKSKVNLEPDGFAAEIRSAFRNMEKADQFTLLNELVKANRGAELAAIVKSPAILTGISPELQAQYAELIVSHHAPAEFAEQAALMEAMNVTLTATSVARKAAEDYSDPIKLASIERGESDAAAADAAFANAFSG